MATLHIQEYGSIDTHEQAAKEPPIATQAVTYTTSTQSSALNGQTELVRLVADEPAYVEFDASPTATASSMLLPANSPEYFKVTANSGLKIAAYDGFS